MIYILDTNSIIFWLKGIGSLEEQINAHENETITTTIISVCELQYGIAKSESKYRKEN